MTSILLVLAILVAVIYIVKALIDINVLVIRIKKDEEINKIPNELEKKYQFIKGLY